MPHAATILRLGVLFVLVAASLALSIGVNGTFTSPDENANFVFASTVAKGEGLCVVDDAASLADGLAHPRSTVVVDECIVPASFIGLPVLAGGVGAVFGAWGILLVTPLFALLAVVCFWDIVRRVWGDERLADMAALFAFAHPAWLALSSRVIMHNVAFVASLIIALWFAVVAFPKRRVLAMFLSGIAVGLAIALRAFELPWVFASVILLAVALRLSVTWRRTFAWCAGCALVLAALGVWNVLTYGSPFASGYLVDVPSAAAPPSAVSAIAPAWSASGVLTYVLPFGFDAKAIVKNSWYYGVSLFPLATALAVAGAGLAFWRGKRPSTAEATRQRATRVVAYVTFGLTLWLAVVYGSWTFADNPDPSAITIGNSHVRYWLPLFVLGGFLAASAVRRVEVAIAARSRGFAAAFVVAVALAFVTASAAAVLLGSDGTLATRRALASFAVKRDAVIAATEQNAVIVVDRADKYLFPLRSVVVPLRSDATYAALPELALNAPLYYFGITLPSEDITYLNDVKLAKLGLRIDLVATIDEESLYRLMIDP